MMKYGFVSHHNYEVDKHPEFGRGQSAFKFAVTFQHVTGMKKPFGKSRRRQIDRDIIRTWLDENIGGEYSLSYSTVFFEREEDATFTYLYFLRS